LLVILGVVIGGVAVLCCGGGAAMYFLTRGGAQTIAADPLPVLPVPRMSVAPSTSDAPLPLDADHVYKGSGSKVVLLAPAAPVVHMIAMTHNGSGGFAVNSLDVNGGIAALLGHGYGKYGGTMLLDSREQAVALQIRATGSWELVVRDARKAPAWTGQGAGTISTVLQVDPDTVSSLTTVTYSHQGRDNFVVRSYDSRSWQLLVNEIGKVQGETVLPVGARFIEVEASGAWTFTRRP